jgi:hypothetical protein
MCKHIGLGGNRRSDGSGSGSGGFEIRNGVAIFGI